MLNFTVGGRGRGVYTKLRLINEIKSYVTYLIANSSAEIYFFSNIEVGHSFVNPHLHTQIWSDDKNAVRAIYDKVITKFGLVKSRCKLTEPQRTSIWYDYVIKDYSKNLSDNEVWNIERTKIRMREKMKTKVRFYSKSKGKYTQKAYRYFYRAFGVLRGVADEFMDYFFSLFFKKKRIFKTIISSFISIKNKGGFAMCKLCTLVDKTVFPIILLNLMSFWMCVPANAPPVCEARVRIFMLKEFFMFLLWIGFFYLVLFWSCLSVGVVYLYLWVYLVVVVTVVEVRSLSPPLVLFLYVVLILGF